MEAFIEILLKREETIADKISLVCSIIGIILISLVGICFNKLIFSLAPLVLFFDIFIIRYMILCKQIEFEYTIVGNEVDIDKIIAKRKRKRLLTIKKTQVISSGNVEDRQYIDCRKRSLRVVNASSLKYSKKNCYVLLNDNKKTMVILDNIEAVLKVIKK